MRLKNTVLFLGCMGVLTLSMTGCGKTKIDLNKYMTVDVEGYDSFGTADYNFDYDKFLDDYEGKIKVNKKNCTSEIEDQLTYSDPESILLDTCVSASVDNGSGLSNGDEIKISWDCDVQKAEEIFNCKLEYRDIQHKISELKKPKKFDPFENLNVQFEGTSPKGKLIFDADYSKEQMQYINFVPEKTEGLKEGEKVTVTAFLMESEDTFVNSFGTVLSESEKTYTVSGLGQYINHVSQIPEETIEEVDSQLQDTLKADFASWENENLVNMEFIGNYVLSSNNDEVDPYSYTYFLYKVTAENDRYDGPFEYY